MLLLQAPFQGVAGRGLLDMKMDGMNSPLVAQRHQRHRKPRPLIGKDTLMSICTLLTLVVILTAGPARAHPGNVAPDGCHYCRPNCAKWGEVEGKRHCHRDRQRAPSRRNVQPPARRSQAAQERTRKIPIEIRDSTPRIVDADPGDGWPAGAPPGH